MLSSLDANFARELSGVRERVLEASEKRLLSAEISYAHILDERRTLRADAVAKFTSGGRVAPAPAPRPPARGRRSRGRSQTTLPMGGSVIAEEERQDESSGSEPSPRGSGSGAPRRNSVAKIAAALRKEGGRGLEIKGRRSSLSCIDNVLGRSDEEEGADDDVTAPLRPRRRPPPRALRRALTALPKEKAPLLQGGAQTKGYAAVDVDDGSAKAANARESPLSRFKQAGRRVKVGVQMATKPTLAERDLPRYLHDAHVHAESGCLHRCGASFEHLWRVACCEVHRCPAVVARIAPFLASCLVVDDHLEEAVHHESGIVSSSHLALLLLWGTRGFHLAEGIVRSEVAENAHEEALQRIMGGFRLIMMLTALYFAFFVSTLLPRDGASTLFRVFLSSAVGRDCACTSAHLPSLLATFRFAKA